MNMCMERMDLPLNFMKYVKEIISEKILFLPRFITNKIIYMKKLLLTLVVVLTATTSFSQNYKYYLNSWYSDDLQESKEFYYDEDFKVVADYWFDYVGETTIVRDTLNYDANGNVLRLSCHQFLNNEWLYANYVDYTYNELNQRITRDNYNNFGGTFEHGGTYNYQYDENGNMVHYDMIFGSWGLFETADFTYDANNNCILEMYCMDNYSGGFDPSAKTEYTYNADGFLVEMKSYYYEYGSWTINTQKVYTRDENNNVTIEESFDAYGAVVERHEYEYDMNMLFEDVAPYVNPEGENPNPVKTANARILDKFWTQSDGGTLTYICDYYYYYKEIEHESVEENIAENVNVYPNPATDNFTIQSNDYQRVELIDAAGKLVFSSNFENVLTISTEGMASGVYFVKLIGNEKVKTEKVILK